MVHKDTVHSGVRGNLLLEPEHLAFRPDVSPSARLDALGPTVMALDEISRVAKARGSPVLEVHTTTPGLPPVVMFFFAQPPTTHRSMRTRAYGATLLGASNAFLGEDVAAWADAIRSAMAR
jgi:hypothetical protein